MKRSSFALFSLALAVACSCQRIVGIHDSELAVQGGAGQSGARDAASSSGGTVSGSGGTVSGGGGTVSGGGGAIAGRGGSAGPASTGGDADTTETPDQESADGARADGSAKVDAGPTDPGASDGPGMDETGDAPIDLADGTLADVAVNDAAACGPLWHAQNVPVQLMTVAPGSVTACTFSTDTLPAFAAAINPTDFRNSLACGACLRVQTSLSAASVVVQVVELGGSGLLLSRQAIEQIDPGVNVFTADWQLVPCDTQNEPLRYLIKAATNANYASLQVQNHRYPVASVASVGNDGATIALTRLNYNVWESGILGAGPLTLRLTDINGQTVEDSGIDLTPLRENIGQSQFPICQ